MQFETIIVALDYSEMSKTVIAALDNLNLEITKTEIVFCHVLAANYKEQESLDQPHPSPEYIYQSLEQQLHSYQAKLENSILEIVNGDPAEEIIRLANIYQADLIVIGNRGFKGVKRIIEDSVSSQVVADAPCCVLVVK